ncbi:MFS transporter [Actinomarinicola tropica]|uniref:MFS transporter n=1 Tax=Actinomarinicola tropica TaxID=2789776 RepID=UPI001E384017|nr:MFS transporter [Actinomarinicola tropica]
MAELTAVPEPSTTEPEQRIYYGYYLVVAALVAQFVSMGAGNYILGPFLEPMTEDLGWSRSEFTLARTIGQVVLAGCGVFIGAHVDRNGGRRLMLVGTAVLATSMVALSAIDVLWQWLLVYGIAASTGAAMTGNLVVNVTLSKWFVVLRGRAVGWASMGVSLAGVALTPLATAMIDAWGWRVAWRGLAVGALVLLVPAALVMRRAPEDHGLNPDGASAEQAAGEDGERARVDLAESLTAREALRTSAFYLLVVAFGMFVVTIGVMLLQTVPFMTDAGYDRSTASFMITLASVPALLSKPAWGFLMDRYPPNKLASLGAAVTGASMVILTSSVRAGFDQGAYLGFFLLGLGWGGLIPLQEVIWATFFGRRHLGAVRSAAMPFSLVIGAGAPLLASWYFDQVGNYDGAFYAVAAMNATAAVLLLFARRPTRTAPPPAEAPEVVAPAPS